MVSLSARGALGQVLLGQPPTRTPEWTIGRAEDSATLRAYQQLRHEEFVLAQGLFERHDRDAADDDPRGIVLVARQPDGTVLGGVRLGPVTSATETSAMDFGATDTDPTAFGADIGWWQGGRLVVTPQARSGSGVGPALIRAACAHAEAHGVLRFEAAVQSDHQPLFTRLGWQPLRPMTYAGRPHQQMRWPIGRFAVQASATKGPLGALLTGLNLGGPGFVGDDGVPVPGSDLIAACDAIVPSLVERDPEWAGWCGVLVNVNDLAAMGAAPVGLLDALAARDASFAARIMAGLREASLAYGIPVLGGHTQLGVPAALSVTALGRTSTPVAAAGGRAGHRVSLTADLGGDWRRGHTGRQWDSSTGRSSTELQRLTGLVARNRPAAAKDVSMAGVVGTLGMLAEASGCAAILDVAAVPRPSQATMGDWLSCFPGFGMLTAGEKPFSSAETPASTAVCGELVAGVGVQLRWPDGELTTALKGGVTGLGAA